jgi:hypothetical protein
MRLEEYHKPISEHVCSPVEYTIPFLTAGADSAVFCFGVRK